MRFNEFANAQAQLDLLRIIIDNTWSAIAQQAEEQKRAQAAQQTLLPRPKRPTKKLPSPPIASTPPKKPEEADISPTNITTNNISTGSNLTPVATTTKKRQPFATPVIDTDNLPSSPNELAF